MPSDEKKLLRRGVKLFADLADERCGNCEGTPCDDLRPAYVCKHHRWIKEAKKLLRERLAGRGK